jgi:outer membrane protein
MKFKILFVILGLALINSSSLFADNIGYVEMDRLFKDSKIVKNYEDNIASKQEKYQELVEKNTAKIEKAKEKEKSQEEIQELITEIEEEMQPFQQEIMQIQAGFQQQLLFEINRAAKEAAEEYAIDVVLDKQFILYGGFNLTDKVLEKLNK